MRAENSDVQPRPCHVCGGSGRHESGGHCLRCNGSGRLWLEAGIFWAQRHYSSRTISVAVMEVP